MRDSQNNNLVQSHLTTRPDSRGLRPITHNMGSCADITFNNTTRFKGIKTRLNVCCHTLLIFNNTTRFKGIKTHTSIQSQCTPQRFNNTTRFKGIKTYFSRFIRYTLVYHLTTRPDSRGLRHRLL